MTATTDVVISEKSMLEFFRSDFSGIAVSRMLVMRMGGLGCHSRTRIQTPFIPAKAGIQNHLRLWPLGPRFRGDERADGICQKALDSWNLRGLNHPPPLGDVRLHIGGEVGRRAALRHDAEFEQPRADVGRFHD